MTPYERAEKLAKVVASLLNYEIRLADTNYAAVIKELVDQIEESEREVEFRKEKEMLSNDYIRAMRKGIEGAVWSAARNQAVEIANTEEELDGPIPEGELEKLLTNPEITLRAVVKITKKNIAERIRKMEAGE